MNKFEIEKDCKFTLGPKDFFLPAAFKRSKIFPSAAREKNLWYPGYCKFWLRTETWIRFRGWLEKKIMMKMKEWEMPSKITWGCPWWHIHFQRNELISNMLEEKAILRNKHQFFQPTIEIKESVIWNFYFTQFWRLQVEISVAFFCKPKRREIVIIISDDNN